MEAEVRRLLRVKTMAWRRFAGIDIAAPEAHFKAQRSALKSLDVTKPVKIAA